MGDPKVAVFEVKCKLEKFKVNLKEKTCSCKVWDLIGAPCVHVISALGWKNQRPEEFVHEYFTKESFVMAYQPLIQPVNGPNLWADTGKDAVQPPNIKRPPGRPKTRRKRDVVEAEIKQQDPAKMRRRLIPTCSKCKGKGHNMRSCNGPSRGHSCGSTPTSSASQNPPTASHGQGLIARVGGHDGKRKKNDSNTSGRKRTKDSSTNWTPYVGIAPQQNSQTTTQTEANKGARLPAGLLPENYTWRG